VSDSLGLVDFAIGLVNSVLNLPYQQVIFCGVGVGGIQITEELQTNLLINVFFFRLVEMTFGLVQARYSLPKWQAVKLTFIAPWLDELITFSKQWRKDVTS